jgi:hypothetical protein
LLATANALAKATVAASSCSSVRESLLNAQVITCFVRKMQYLEILFSLVELTYFACFLTLFCVQAIYQHLDLQQNVFAVSLALQDLTQDSVDAPSTMQADGSEARKSSAR